MQARHFGSLHALLASEKVVDAVKIVYTVHPEKCELRCGLRMCSETVT